MFQRNIPKKKVVRIKEGDLLKFVKERTPAEQRKTIIDMTTKQRVGGIEQRLMKKEN